MNLQRGESDEFSKAMETLLSGFVDGEFEKFILIHSEYGIRFRGKKLTDSPPTGYFGQ